MLVGVTGVTLSYVNLGLQWGLKEWGFFIMAIVSGTTIETALALMIACISFWTDRSSTGFFVMVRLNLMVQQYPVDVFGDWFRVVVTGFVPVAFMNYYPSLMLLGKLDGNSDWWWLSYMSPVVALLLVC